MFNIGIGELALIFAVALLVVGPRDLVKVARWLGRTVKYARKIVRQFMDTIDLDDNIRELKETGKILKDTAGEFKPLYERDSLDKQLETDLHPADTRPPDQADKNETGKE
ncbi:MAG: twin-arginine translocase TatA/TatE family subunit [Treponema sp.]|nr:twin-arginine translocase TatA/TatE family subunit [Treponema sp.]